MRLESTADYVIQVTNALNKTKPKQECESIHTKSQKGSVQIGAADQVKRIIEFHTTAAAPCRQDSLSSQDLALFSQGPFSAHCPLQKGQVAEEIAVIFSVLHQSKEIQLTVPKLILVANGPRYCECSQNCWDIREPKGRKKKTPQEPKKLHL